MIGNHTKYSRKVIPDIEESLSKIAATIDNYSVVLDIGCSSGMMGRYLAAHKGCVIDGVDIDEGALKNCHPIYRKVLIKNLEADDLIESLNQEAYDFIIVADVIEHLNHPENLLKQLRLLVKPHGTIIFSVPNITHIAASLELLSGHFNYATNGLLDSTHVRFYSYQNLVATMAGSGLYLWAVDAVYRQLDETEFGNAQTKLFSGKWLQSLIASRPDSLVYQWIFSLRIYPSLEQTNDFAEQMKRSARLTFATELYWKSGERDEFDEVNKLYGLRIDTGSGEYTVEFKLENLEADGLSQIRVDPVSETKLVWIKDARVTDAHESILWQWCDRETQSELGNAHWVDAIPESGRILCASTDDPQWYPQISQEVLKKLESGARFSIVLCDDTAKIGQQLEVALLRQRQALGVCDQKIVALRQTVVEREDRIVTLRQTVVEIEERIATLRQTVVEREEYAISLHQQVIELEANIHRIFNSYSWTITKPLRYLRRKLRGILNL